MGKKEERQRAIALRHQLGSLDPPRVVASGAGEIAQRIVELAQAHGIPIHQDPDLIRVLAYLDVGESIPSELYRVVAEILVFVYRLNGQYRR